MIQLNHLEVDNIVVLILQNKYQSTSDEISVLFEYNRSIFTTLRRPSTHSAVWEHIKRYRAVENRAPGNTNRTYSGALAGGMSVVRTKKTPIAAQQIQFVHRNWQLDAHTPRGFLTKKSIHSPLCCCCFWRPTRRKPIVGRTVVVSNTFHTPHHNNAVLNVLSDFFFASSLLFELAIKIVSHLFCCVKIDIERVSE